MRRHGLFRLLAAALVAAACGGDGPVGPPPVATPTSLSFASQPSASAQSGTPFSTQPSIRLRDVDNKLVAKAGVAVTASVAGSGASLTNATATTDGSGTATFTGLTLTGLIGSYTIHFAATGLTGLDAQPVALAAGAAAQLAVTINPSATAQAGVALATQPQVQLRDGSGNVVVQAGVTITAALVSGTPTLSGATAQTNAAGVATFSGLTLSGSTGAYTVRFSAPGLVSADAAAPTVLAAGAATQLALTTQPSAAVTNGAVLTTQPVVQLRDAFGNNAPQAGASVVASIVSGPAGGAVAGDTAITDATGKATFTALKITGAVGSYSLRFASAPLSSVVAASATVLSAGAVSQFSLTTQPSNTITNGVAIPTQPAVQLQDQSGNPVAQAGVVITATVGSGTATLTNATATSDATGKATFSGLTVTGTSGFVQLVFSAPTLGSVNGLTMLMGAGAAAGLTVTTQPALTAANTAVLTRQPVVRLVDGSGNFVAQAGVVVTASLVSGGLTIANATATTTGTGAATFAGVSLTGTVGSYTFRFSAPSLTTVDASGPTVLNPGAATQLSLTQQPAATSQSGGALSPAAIVQLRDVSGNAVSQNGVAITASLTSGTGTLSGATANTNASGTATFGSLTISGVAGSYALRFSSGALTAVDAASPTVLSAGAAAQLAVSVEPSAAAQSGVALTTQPAVQILDGAGNAVSQGGTVVTATVVSGTVTIGSATATTTGAGLATFTNLTLTGVTGSYTLRFTATGLTAVNASAPTVLGAGAATKLAVGVQPGAAAQSGVALTQQPAVRLLDASNNAVPQSGVVVTATVVSGTITFGNATATTDAAGLATFSGLSLAGVIGNYTLRFTSGSLTAINASAATVLSAGPASAVSITTQPATSATVAVALSPQPVVRLVDGAGNNVSQAGVTVTATVVSGSATLSNATATTSASGIATFSGLTLAGTAGSYTLRFGAIGVSSIDAASATTLGAGSATQLTLTVEPPTAGQSAAVLTPSAVVQLRDGSGNAVSQSGVLVTASIVGGGASLTGATATTGTGGNATFGSLVISGTTGSYTLRFSATGVSSIDAAAPTVLSAGSATNLTLTAQPAVSAQSGIALAPQPIVQLRDGAGNPVPTSGVVVTASVVSGTITFTNATATTDGAGTATFNGLSLAGVIGSYTLRFSAPSVTSVNASAATVLSAGQAAALTVSQQPSTSAAVNTALAIQPKVRLLDGAGNLVSQSGVVVTASVVSGTVTLANQTATTDGTGTATFTGLSLTAQTGSYLLRFTAPSLTGVNAVASTVLGVGPAAMLTLTVEPPATASNGVALVPQPQVQVRDAGGNAVNASGLTITAAVSGGATVSAGGTATTNGSGLATFSGLTITGTAATYTLQFGSGSLTPVSAAVGTVLSPGAPASLVIITPPPASAQSGVAFGTAPVIEVRDASSNLVVGATVRAEAPGTFVTATNNTALTGPLGQATFTGLTLTGVVSGYSLRFCVVLNCAAASLVVGSTTPTSLLVGPATFLTVTTQPSSAATNGAALAVQPEAHVTDGAGNPIAGMAVTVTTGAGVVIAAGSATTDANGLASFSGLTLTGSVGNYTLHFASAAGPSADASAATILSASAPATVTINTHAASTATNGAIFPTPPVVTVTDASGNPVPGVNVVASAAGATVNNPMATTNGSGVATFTGLGLTGAIATTYTVSFQAGSASASGQSTTLSVGNAEHIGVAQEPSTSATSGIVLFQQPIVHVSDVGFAPVAGSIVVTATAVGATVLGGSVATDGAGNANFTTLRLAGTPGNYTLTFTVQGSSGPISAPSALPVTLAPGSASRLEISTQPSTSAQSGVAFTAQPVVRVTDAGGATVTGSRTITASVVAGNVTLANASFTTTPSSGIANFSGLAVSALVGNYTLVFTSPGLTSATASGPTAVSAGNAAKLLVFTEPANSATADTVLSAQPVVQVSDGAGNAVAAPGVNVSAGFAAGSGSPSGTTAVVTDGAGRATFTNLSVAPAGTYRLRFTSSPVLTPVNAADSLVVSTAIQSATPVPNLTGSVSGSLTQTFAIRVLPGDTVLTVQISEGPGSSGDADLYVRFGEASDLASDVHDCFPNLAGNNETCVFRNPTPGVWYVTLYVFFGFTGVILTATASGH